MVIISLAISGESFRDRDLSAFHLHFKWLTSSGWSFGLPNHAIASGETVRWMKPYRLSDVVQEFSRADGLLKNNHQLLLWIGFNSWGFHGADFLVGDTYPMHSMCPWKVRHSFWVCSICSWSHPFRYSQIACPSECWSKKKWWDTPPIYCYIIR